MGSLTGPFQFITQGDAMYRVDMTTGQAWRTSVHERQWVAVEEPGESYQDLAAVARGAYAQVVQGAADCPFCRTAASILDGGPLL